jgi:hypothetical protein
MSEFRSGDRDDKSIASLTERKSRGLVLGEVCPASSTQETLEGGSQRI